MVNRKVLVDWNLLDHYVQSIGMIKKKYALEHGLSLHDLLTREDILYIVEEENGK